MSEAGGSTDQHLLRRLVFPARYETLVEQVGPDVAKLVVEPPKVTRDALEAVSESVAARGEGALVPLSAQSGTGKTTTAQSLVNFFPSLFSETVSFTREVRYEQLLEAASEARDRGPANDQRIIPINVDHRESDPPSATELANIKRFLREPSAGRRCAIFWPETSQSIAISIAGDYEEIAGKPPVDLPLSLEGPERETWSSIASHTLELSNGVESLELLGVDPRAYNAEEYRSIGDYLRAIADDFTKNRLEILRATNKPIRMIIVIASQSTDAGVLPQLTSNSRFGLADGAALVNATRDSVVGKFWNERRGLLTQMIVQLDLRLLSLAPTASIPILRRHGADKTQADLESMDIAKEGSARVADSFGKTDLGRFLLGTIGATYETRGTPSTVTVPAFDLISDNGAFTSGQDKALNHAMLSAVEELFERGGVPADGYAAEKPLPFCPLQPDNSFELNGEIHCIEYTWRKGDFLSNAHRAAIANYVLEKVRNYARELGRL